MKHLQIHWPQDMREETQDRREFSHWCEAAASLDQKKPEKKRNTKQKDNSNEDKRRTES